MKEKIMDMINSKDGVWFVNEAGLYIKIWIEHGSAIIRAYCEDDGRRKAHVYKCNPDNIMIREEGGRTYLGLKDEFVDAIYDIGESDAPSDKKADTEYLAGNLDAIPASSELVWKLTVSPEMTEDELLPLAKLFENLPE